MPMFMNFENGDSNTRLYNVTATWQKKDGSVLRQEYFIAAKNSADAKSIAHNHVPAHLTKSISPDFEDKVKLKVRDYGMLLPNRTYYTSPIMPNTYKQFLPDTENESDETEIEDKSSDTEKPEPSLNDFSDQDIIQHMMNISSVLWLMNQDADNNVVMGPCTLASPENINIIIDFATVYGMELSRLMQMDNKNPEKINLNILSSIENRPFLFLQAIHQYIQLMPEERPAPMDYFKTTLQQILLDTPNAYPSEIEDIGNTFAGITSDQNTDTIMESSDDETETYDDEVNEDPEDENDDEYPESEDEE